MEQLHSFVEVRMIIIYITMPYKKYLCCNLDLILICSDYQTEYVPEKHLGRYPTKNYFAHVAEPVEAQNTQNTARKT